MAAVPGPAVAWRTTLENVAFPLQAAGMPKPERLERARALIKLVGLEGFENRYPRSFQGECDNAPQLRERSPSVLVSS